ncbi:hypothetical protein PHYBOEH_009393 [Phytophthora boehmeriae]|uniref:PIH1 N-terminal domain-containing protein n=1 Tax=Phytophthora boehmeriae TaxID=109152 RepID=A0A8T1WZ96_9STRA|nr:hypothetical protein PHYBOEH_009393 [Phytophthora boehmeriae]
MNYGIINNRRPDPRKRGGAASMQTLLADPRMREIAKQMGLQPKDFGEGAQALWQTLNDLSASDPKRYESFINEQLQDGPPILPSTEESSSNQTTPEAPRFFTPDPGFVVKCSMYHSVKCQQVETKLFLNICAHALIDAPKNPNSGAQVPEDTHAVPTTNRLQIPLVVGKLREITDFSGALCCAVDVVVNPWVLRRTLWDANFKREVMKLAVQWVQQDAKVQLVTPSGKFIKARYKGGVTVGSEIITSKLRIDDADPSKQRMESPADLLKQINLDEAEGNATTEELLITPSKTTKTNKNQAQKVLVHEPSTDFQPPPAPVQAKENKSQNKVLIEELPSPPSKQITAHHRPGNIPKTAPTASKTPAQLKNKSNGGVVKRGFLNSTKSQLYPKGSNEGRPSSAYVNLLSRSQVVDLGEMERQQKAQQDQRKATMAFLQQTEDKANPKAGQKRAVSSNEEIDHGDHIFEQLCRQAEPDLQSTPGHRDATRGNGTDAADGDHLLGTGFEELAKLLTP